MASFPTLKTGAVAQYPLQTGLRYASGVVQFLDGSRQSYRIQGPALRRWSIQLNGLDEGELADVTAFVEQQCLAPFTFTDPVTGQTAARCIIAGQRMDAAMMQEENGQATLIIEEIP
jgi:hypothetical protein